MNIPTIEELIPVAMQAQHNALSSVARLVAVVAACRPQLRPIAEMPNEVPEGCERLYGLLYDGGGLAVTSFRGPRDTLYIDIALPVEAYPADFEQAFAESGLDAKDKDSAFKLWKGGAR